MLTTIFTKQDLEDLEKSGNKIRITCPHCKTARYLPGEIFMPGPIIGKPVEVVKDALGDIIFVDYDKEKNLPNLTESYICDYCNKPFVVEASITYKAVFEAPEKDFSQEYVSLL